MISANGSFALGPAVVTALTDDSPAKAAGLTVGDTIVAVNGQAVTDGRTSFAGPPGAEMIYRVRRDGVERDVKFRVARKSRAETEPAP